VISVKQIKRLPDSPGVYFFLGSPKHGEGGKNILYIGKATSLRSRVKSYFSRDLFETRGPKVARMLSQATGVDFSITDSVLEALILEAALIKKHQPKGNSAEKDDKSWNYVVITKEKFPRVVIVRGKELSDWTENIKESFGPFPHGLELREALKIVRKILPFRDTCIPFGYPVTKRLPGNQKACFSRQIGLCPGVCTGEITKHEYTKVIRSISLFFRGKKKNILKGLRKHMRQEAKLRNFEKAAELRNKIRALEHINDMALIKRKDSDPSTSLDPARDKSLGAMRSMRIEAYDIAHISGTHTVGSMVVMEDGVLARHEYKRFKIRTRTNDDVGSLTEVLTRRLRHREWRMPDLIVIDGGSAQLGVAKFTIEHLRFNIPLVSVVKNAAHKPDHIIGDSKIVCDYHHDILLVNQEAHRFAINYHRKLRDKISS